MHRSARIAAGFTVLAGVALLLALTGTARGGPGVCGGPGSPCCDMGPPCTSPGLICVNDTCENCGMPQQPCCAGDFCTFESVCVGGTCTPCGEINDPCCDVGPPDDCRSGSLCVGNTCVACGDLDQPCCTEFPECRLGQTCLMGTCEECGAAGEPCCEGPQGIPCLSGNVCSPLTDLCEPCGDPGQFCCPGNDCTAPAQCNGIICSTCGGVSQPACTPTATPTATATATATATNTPLPNGAACTTPSLCASGFCVDGVCCDTACTGELESCDGADPGTCTSLAAPAPALSPSVLGLAGLMLLAIAALALWRRAR